MAALKYMLFTSPDPTASLTSIGNWATPIFDAFLPIGYVAIGISIAALLAILLMHIVPAIFHHFVKGASSGTVPMRPFRHYETEREQFQYHQNLTSAYYLSKDDPIARARVVAQMEEESKFIMY